jgi:hypothetical protein
VRTRRHKQTYVSELTPITQVQSVYAAKKMGAKQVPAGEGGQTISALSRRILSSLLQPRQLGAVNVVPRSSQRSSTAKPWQ